MRFLLHSEKGGDHAENEDFAAVREHPSAPNRFIAAIADGQGGRADGAIASRIACEHALSLLAERPWSDIHQPSLWERLIQSADETVRANCEGFTTLIVFAIDPTFLVGTSVGDSTLYFFNGKIIIELTQRQRKNPPIGDGCTFGTRFSLPDPRGQLLAATDGVWKYCGFQQIQESLGAPIERAKEIIRPHCVLKSGGLPDDFTLIAGKVGAEAGA